MGSGRLARGHGGWWKSLLSHGVERGLPQAGRQTLLDAFPMRVINATLAVACLSRAWRGKLGLRC